ncbi:hypothetical protein HDV05_008142 [Chytridiales sp. JEL 0842]|nr:hypothetical protein HDV05_008142 [Chytridiales sp. JEL 0842]
MYLAEVCRTCKTLSSIGVGYLYRKPLVDSKEGLDGMLRTLMSVPRRPQVEYVDLDVGEGVAGGVAMAQQEQQHQQEVKAEGTGGTLGGGQEQTLDSICPQLAVLDLSEVPAVDKSVLGALEAGKLKGLRTLELNGCVELTDEGLERILVGEGVERVGLKKLGLARCEKLTDRGLETVVRTCRHLIDLKLVGCTGLSAASLCWIFGQPLPASDVSLAEVSPAAESATAITVGDQRHEVQANVPRLENLRDLDLGGCTQITESLLRFLKPFSPSPPPSSSTTTFPSVTSQYASTSISPSLAPNTPPIKPLTSLRSLNLSNLPHLSDSHLYTLLSHTPSLRNLYLYRCTSLTDFSMGAVTTLSRTLQVLHLTHCVGVGDEGLKRLAKGCRRLKYLDLVGLNSITDASILEICQQCIRLKRISIAKCTKLTDISLFYIAHSEYLTKSLERLHASYCPLFTLKGVQNVVEECKKLVYLTLTGCTGVLKSSGGEGGLRRFSKEIPRDVEELYIRQRERRRQQNTGVVVGEEEGGPVEGGPVMGFFEVGENQRVGDGGREGGEQRDEDGESVETTRLELDYCVLNRDGLLKFRKALKGQVGVRHVVGTAGGSTGFEHRFGNNELGGMVMPSMDESESGACYDGAPTQPTTNVMEMNMLEGEIFNLDNDNEDSAYATAPLKAHTRYDHVTSSFSSFVGSPYDLPTNPKSSSTCAPPVPGLYRHVSLGSLTNPQSLMSQFHHSSFLPPTPLGPLLATSGQQQSRFPAFSTHGQPQYPPESSATLTIGSFNRGSLQFTPHQNALSAGSPDLNGPLSTLLSPSHMQASSSASISMLSTSAPSSSSNSAFKRFMR